MFLTMRLRWVISTEESQLLFQPVFSDLFYWSHLKHLQNVKMHHSWSNKHHSSINICFASNKGTPQTDNWRAPMTAINLLCRCRQERSKYIRHLFKTWLHSEALSVLMLCMPSKCRWPFCIFEYFYVLSIFLWKIIWHKLRNVYRIWQVATVILIYHNMGVLKELSCQM